MPTTLHGRTRRKVAAVADKALTYLLMPEVDLFLLQDGDWEMVLREWKPDLLLLGGVWWGVGGHFETQIPFLEERGAPIREMIRVAGTLGIPTLFWYDLDDFYSDRFLPVAHLCDHTVIFDEQATATFQKALGVERVTPSLPLLQTELHHPFLSAEEQHDTERGRYLFHEWSDVFEFPYKCMSLNAFAEADLRIVDHRFEIYKKKAEESPLSKYIDGYLTDEEYWGGLPFHDALILLEHTLSPAHRRERDILEATMSGLPTVMLGSASSAWRLPVPVIECPVEPDPAQAVAEHMAALSPWYRYTLWRAAAQAHGAARNLPPLLGDEPPGQVVAVGRTFGADAEVRRLLEGQSLAPRRVLAVDDPNPASLMGPLSEQTDWDYLLLVDGQTVEGTPDLLAALMDAAQATHADLTAKDARFLRAAEDGTVYAAPAHAAERGASADVFQESDALEGPVLLSRRVVLRMMELVRRVGPAPWPALLAHALSQKDLRLTLDEGYGLIRRCPRALMPQEVEPVSEEIWQAGGENILRAGRDPL